MRITFCGVGALGSTTAVYCRNFDAQLVFIDHDRVESKNLLSQAYVKQSIAKNKAQALRLQLQNFYGITCEAINTRIAKINVDAILKNTDLIVDCFDNAASRQVLSDYAKNNNTPLVHAGISADGSFGIVRWDEHFVADTEDTPGQATCEGGEHLPLIGLVSATLARVIQDFLTHQEKKGYMITLNGVVRQG